MSTAEILTIVVAVAGLLVGVIKIWVDTNVKIAKIESRLTTDIQSLKVQLDLQRQELLEHKKEDERKFEQIHRENREDHRLMFDKIDELVKKVIRA